MKLAVQHHLVAGATLQERFQRALDYGFDGVELTVWGFDGPIEDHFDVIDAAKTATGISISTICTAGSDDLVVVDAPEREKRIVGLVSKLRFAHALGAKGVIALPLRAAVRVPDLSPIADEMTMTHQLLLSSLSAGLAQTADLSTEIFLEPLNRYEARFLRTVGHAADLCDVMGDPRVKVMADLYHMNIEEAHPPTALREAGAFVGHVHVADSQRLEPGKGHLNFLGAFEALKQIGFSGWMAMECGLSGEASDVLPASVQFLRQTWEKARSA